QAQIRSHGAVARHVQALETEAFGDLHRNHVENARGNNELFALEQGAQCFLRGIHALRFPFRFKPCGSSRLDRAFCTARCAAAMCAVMTARAHASSRAAMASANSQWCAVLRRISARLKLR